MEVLPVTACTCVTGRTSVAHHLTSAVQVTRGTETGMFLSQQRARKKKKREVNEKHSSWVWWVLTNVWSRARVLWGYFRRHRSSTGTLQECAGQKDGGAFFSRSRTWNVQLLNSGTLYLCMLTIQRTDMTTYVWLVLCIYVENEKCASDNLLNPSSSN